MKINWLDYRDVSEEDLLNYLDRIERAYNLLEQNKKEPLIIRKNDANMQFLVRSSKDKDKFYDVDADIKICNCPDFNFRLIKCKHIIATEFILLSHFTF